MSDYKTIRDIDVNGKRVLVRAALDVPLNIKKDLLDPERVIDDTRIRDIIPTLKYLIENNARIILAAGWCGRPKGVDPDFSMAPVAKKIESLLREKGLLKHEVLIAPDCFRDNTPRNVYSHKDEVIDIVDSLTEGQIVVMENVRYDPEANANDRDFAAFFASLADVYVNEAEAQNHRPEATIVTVPLLIAEKGGEVVFGLKYVEVLDKIGGLRKKLAESNRGNFVFGLCGKKIESDPGITSKITVGRDLIDDMKAGDTIITGGAVVYTFLLAEYYAEKIKANYQQANNIVLKYDEEIGIKTKGVKDKKEAALITENIQKQKSEELKKLIGIEDGQLKNLIGNSYIRWGQEGEQIVFAYNVMEKANSKGVHVVTAYDHAITDSLPDKFGNLPDNAGIKIFQEATGIPAEWLGVAEGPKTVEKISQLIEKAGIYLQSGPYSIEDKRVEEISGNDTLIFEAVRKCKENGGITIGAGGDTVARINAYNASDSFSTITSAGGATLELIQSGTSRGKDAVMKAQEILAR